MNQIAVRDERTLAIEQKINQQVSSAMSVGTGGITFQNAGEVMEYAKMMAVSGSAVPKHLRGQPGACLGIIDDAIRFQTSPYALARKSYFVNDNLAYEAQVLAGIVNAHAPLKQRPDVKYEGEGPDRVCVVTAEFRDGALREYRSPKLKDIHPKNSPLWKSDPDQQLSYYSLRGFARRHCPEIILGIYDVEEMRSIDHQEVEARPALADRLSVARRDQPQEDPQEREGFDADFVARETSALSGGAEIEHSEPSPANAPAGDAGSGETLSSEPAAEEAGIEAEDDPAAVPASDWLKPFAKAIVAAIQVDEEFVVNTSKGLFVEGLSDDTRERAKAIINYARSVCRGEIERADALEIIAGKAGAEVGEITP